MQVTVVLLFSTKSTKPTVHELSELHSQVECEVKNWIGARSNSQVKVDLLECHTGSNPFWSEEIEKAYER